MSVDYDNLEQAEGNDMIDELELLRAELTDNDKIKMHKLFCLEEIVRQLTINEEC